MTGAGISGELKQIFTDVLQVIVTANANFTNLESAFYAHVADNEDTNKNQTTVNNTMANRVLAIEAAGLDTAKREATVQAQLATLNDGQQKRSAREDELNNRLQAIADDLNLSLIHI